MAPNVCLFVCFFFLRKSSFRLSFLNLIKLFERLFKKYRGDGGGPLLIQQTRYVFCLLIFLNFIHFCALLLPLWLLLFNVFFSPFSCSRRDCAIIVDAGGRGAQPRKVRKVNDRGGNEVTRPSAAQKKKNNVGLFIGGSSSKK